MADFILVGGDARQRQLAYLLRQEGHRVRTYGVAADPQDMVDEDQAIVCLPVPSFRGGRIPGEYGTALEAQKALTFITGRHCILYGTAHERQLAQSYLPKSLHNLAEDEIFLQENAELTAEGAIRAASGVRGRALWHSRCVVLGFGRIGRALVLRLLAMGASVCVAARRREARQQAQALGASVCDFSALPDGADFVFNTVPEPVIPQEKLIRLVGEGLYVELSSAPYGIDQEEADAAGIRNLFLPGIPGKYYPQSAAIGIRDAYFRWDLAGTLFPDSQV